MIDGLPVIDLGATALLAIVFLLVVTGRLLPRRTVDDTVNNLKEERDHWRTAAEERSSQLSELLAATDTSTKLIEALTDVANVHKERQEPNP